MPPNGKDFRKAVSEEFDRISEEYDRILKEQVSFFEKDIDYFAEIKAKIAREVFDEAFGRRCESVLEWGCGTGRNIPFLIKHFGCKITGTDISERSLEVARKREKTAQIISWDDLTKNPREFDLVFVSCVLHHIPPQERKNELGKVTKLIRKKGGIIIFEHNPLNPVVKYIVKRSPIDRDAVLLKMSEVEELLLSAGLRIKKKGYYIFFPSFLSPLRRFERMLRGVPLGGQYFVLAEKV